MVEHRLEVLLKLSDKAGDIQVGVNSVGQGEVICFCKDLDSMRESTLSSHSFLEGRGGSPSAVDLSVE